MSPRPSTPAALPGPLARKVVAALHQRRRQNVIDLVAWQAAKHNAAQISNTLISQPELADLDPAHGMYVYAQNHLAVLIEQLAELPMLAQLTHAYQEAEDEYMPLGPPMSPLTTSYFTSWGAFDLSVGLQRESLASIAIAVCRALGAHADVVTLFETLQHSRMGLYRYEGGSGAQAVLTELITQHQHHVIVPSGYRGQAGELWLARLLPPPPILSCRYGVVFTTLYLLGGLDERGRYAPALEADWLAYLARTLPALKCRDDATAYERLMKQGRSRHYWNEYIFLAYVNHREDRIYLAGLPDIPRSLPHSKAGQARWGD